MSGKRISELPSSSYLTTSDLLLVEKTDGNTISLTASSAKLFFSDHTHPSDKIAGLSSTVGNIVTTEVASMLSTEQTVTNLWNLLTVSYKRVDLGSVSGNIALNLSTGMYFTATISGPTTFTITNPKTGAAINTLGITLNSGGSYPITWPVGIIWPNNEAPTLNAYGKDILTFLSDDNGTTWHNVGQSLSTVV
jgi:hypothetical protein